MTSLPFQAEYAKSGRASCKGCKQKIDQGELRIAIMVQSSFFDGKQPNWHHEDCIFKKGKIMSVSDIANFTKLKTADKKRIKERVEQVTGIVMPVEKGKGKKKRGAPDNNLALKDFLVEYSKSSRASCKLCDIKICKDEIRVCKIMHDTELGMKFGGQPFWYHLKCFNEDRDTLGYMAGGNDLPGFKLLSKEDQNIVKNEIKSKSIDEVPIKKLKSEPKDKDEIKKEKALEKTIEKQNKLFHKHRSALQEYKKADLHELLEVNNQEIPAGLDECKDRLADYMTFGVLLPCPECKGQLTLDNFFYKCTGDISQWTKCQYTTVNPKREKMVIPDGFKSSSAFHKYKPKLDVRLFESAPPPATIVKKDEPQPKKNIPIPPLKNLQFFVYGKVPDKDNLKKRILKLGGLTVTKPIDTMAAVISTEADVEKMTAKMEEIKSGDFEVVDPSFLDKIDPSGSVADTLELIKVHNIASWGSDPAKRVPQDVIDGKSVPKSGSFYVSSTKSATTKLKIKGGTAVDPDSGLVDVAHVYKDRNGTKYTVVLGKTDVVAQKNSYYKLQLLAADNIKKKYWLFRSWGRIGTTIGQNKLEECNSLDEAMNRFENLYMEKTENPWECRDMFDKMPGCYYPIEVDYDEAAPSQALAVDTRCSLPEPVQKLVCHIFDIAAMKQTLLEFELDTEKMPLGKLSRNQILAGYRVLSEILKLIEKGNASQNQIIDATNRFFTMIPHDFGVNNPPLLDSVETVRQKASMLDNLLEIEIAYSLLDSDKDTDTSPVESHYRKLKCELAPLDRKSEEFDMILQYVQNTHAQTHANYTLDVEQVFSVVREGESKRFKPFKKLHNRRLLWHGSRVTNFAGILSQGLRIAPPEAPVTGYMFGKGIYFADMVSKSANYCGTSRERPSGVMLLCEVALGDMKECTSAEMITKLPSGLHSAWGRGRTQPDPAQARTLPDGTMVPLGAPVPVDVRTSLLYNEFIVYDVAQVNVKYLLQMKFNHKY